MEYVIQQLIFVEQLLKWKVHFMFNNLKNTLLGVYSNGILIWQIHTP